MESLEVGHQDPAIAAAGKMGIQIAEVLGA